MPLWILWANALQQQRPAFTRLQTFLLFATTVAGFAVRTELLGVTSIVRALNLRPKCYEQLLGNMHSSGVRLDKLNALWTAVVPRIFPNPLRVNGRLVFVGDGINIPKRGKKMPSVKLLHQQSGNNKAEYIMGHSLQAVSVLVQAAGSVLAVPLAIRIHEGAVWSNRDTHAIGQNALAAEHHRDQRSLLLCRRCPIMPPERWSTGYLSAAITWSRAFAPMLSRTQCPTRSIAAGVGGLSSTVTRSFSKTLFDMKPLFSRR